VKRKRIIGGERTGVRAEVRNIIGRELGALSGGELGPFIHGGFHGWSTPFLGLCVWVCGGGRFWRTAALPLRSWLFVSVVPGVLLVIVLLFLQ
jgi:hypothetical protein